MQQNYRYNEKVFFKLVKKNLSNYIQILRQAYLDYTYIIYVKTFNQSFKRKVEMAQHKAALVFTGAIKGPSRAWFRIFNR